MTCLAVFVIFGTFNFTRNALPGNFLFPLKQLAEKGRVVFAPENEKASIQLEIANQRVEELAKIAKTGQNNGNLITAIQALNNDISSASEQIKNAQPEQKQILADKTLELIKKTQDVVAQIVSQQIQFLETRTLSEEQTKILNEAKEDLKSGNFEQALEKIYQIQ